MTGCASIRGGTTLAPRVSAGIGLADQESREFSLGERSGVRHRLARQETLRLESEFETLVSAYSGYDQLDMCKVAGFLLPLQTPARTKTYPC